MKIKFLIRLFFPLLFALYTFTLASAQEEISSKDSKPFQSFQGVEEVRNALLIANNIYEGNIPTLTNPIPEAHALKLKLEAIGFKVVLVENADKYGMEEALFNFGKKCKKEGGLAFFHYGGHAVQIDGKNYLIPSYEEVGSIGQVDSNCVNVKEVMDSMKANENIIVLDSCRDNPFASSNEDETSYEEDKSTSSSKTASEGAEITNDSSARVSSKSTRGLVATKSGLAIITNRPRNSIVVFSAQAGEPAQDGVYTPTLMQYITEKNIQLENMLKKVRQAVLDITKDRQKPGEYTELVSTIFLGGLDTDSVEGEQLIGTLDISTRTPCSITLSNSMIRSAVINSDIDYGAPKRFEFPTGSYTLKIKYKDGKNEYRTGVIRYGKNEMEKLTYLSKEQVAKYIELAKEFLNGFNGKAKNVRKALEYYRLAADEGDSEAEFAIGHCFETGEGVATDEEEAFEWYKKAQKKGNGEAMLRMAIFYHYGKGDVTIDYTKARKWYEKAIASRHSEQVMNRAKEGLAELNALIAEENEERKWVEKKERRVKKDRYEAPWYSFALDLAYNSSYITHGVNFGATGIKLGLIYMQWQFGILTMNVAFNYLMCASTNFAFDTAMFNYVRPLDIKLGLAFGRFAFSFGVVQLCFRFTDILPQGSNQLTHSLDSGFVWSINAEFRFNQIVAFYAEYEPSGILFTSKDIISGHHALNFGIKVNVITLTEGDIF